MRRRSLRDGSRRRVQGPGPRPASPAPTARARPRCARACRRRRRSPSPSAGGSRRGCSWPSGATGWRRRGPSRSGSARARRPAATRCRGRPPSGGLRELAVDDDERAVGIAVVVQADGLAGGPAEQPHLVGRRGQEARPDPLVGVVGDVGSPQRLGGGQAGDDVGRATSSSRSDRSLRGTAGRRTVGAVEAMAAHDIVISDQVLSRIHRPVGYSVWYERGRMSFVRTATVLPDGVTDAVYVHVVGASVGPTTSRRRRVAHATSSASSTAPAGTPSTSRRRRPQRRRGRRPLRLPRPGR